MAKIVQPAAIPTNLGPLTPAMQRRVLSVILKNPLTFSRCRSFLAADLFKDVAASDILAWSLAHFDRTREVPSKSALLDAFSRNAENVEVVKRVFKLVVEDEVYTVERIAQYARRLAVKRAMTRAIHIMHAEDNGEEPRDENGKPIKDNPLELIQSAFTVGTDVGDMGVYLDEALARSKDRTRNPKARELFYTGLEHLDQCGVAVERGEIGCVLAKAKGGKSFVLLNIALNNLFAGKNVVYFNLEIKEDRLEDRFASAMAGPKADRKVDPEDYIRRMERRYARLVPDGARMRIKRYLAKTTTIDMLRSYLLSCRADGFNPDLVVVDYPGIMKPAHMYAEVRHNLSSLWLDFRALAQEFDVAGWGAAQANRTGASSELVTDTSIGESYEVIQHIDVGFSISRTEDEIENNQGRFFVFSSRNDRDGVLIDFTEDYGRGLVKTTGIHSREDTKKARGKSSAEQREEAAFHAAKGRKQKAEAPDERA
jgi:replicative DNA helicase